MGEVEIVILHTAECPFWREAMKVAEDAARELGVDADVYDVLVSTEDEARELGFPGSPTVLMNGHDVEPLEELRAGPGVPRLLPRREGPPVSAEGVRC